MQDLKPPQAGTPVAELRRVMSRWRFWFLFWNSLYYVLGLSVAVLAAAATQEALFGEQQLALYSGIAALLSAANLALSPKEKAEKFRSGFVGLKSALSLSDKPNLDRARGVYDALTGAGEVISQWTSQQEPSGGGRQATQPVG